MADIPYEFKASAYSSHTLTLACFPSDGRGARVLDVGCGNGYLSALLAERGFDVTGVERAGGYDERFPKSVKLVEADLERGLPELDGEFDYILCADILEHLRRPEDLLAQSRGRLTRGGAMVASLPNSGNLYFRLNVLAGRFPQEDKGLFDRTHVRFYMWAGWRKLFGDAGFEFERTLVTGIPVGLVMGESLPVRVAERLCYDLARLWKTLFAYQFVVVTRCK